MEAEGEVMKKLWRKLFPIREVYIAKTDYNPVAGFIQFQGSALILTKNGELTQVFERDGMMLVQHVANIRLYR